MAIRNSKEKNYSAFIKELGALTKKYGIVISVYGNVEHITDEDGFEGYTDDITSGDIEPVFKN